MANCTSIKSRKLLIAACSTILFLASFSGDTSVLENILQKLKTYHEENPQEKLYLHLDKPFYAVGETIWFKAYLTEASLHSLDSQSRVVYVELITDQKLIFKRQMHYAPDGTTFGDLQLPDTLQEGTYIVRAYTNHMRNAGEDFFFKREISVLNPFRKQETDSTKTLSPDSVELNFFPEGGNLVACGFNRIAFKALSPDGRGIAIEGEIIDEQQKVVTTFKTQHEGMGIVRINPEAGKKYYALITKPYAVKRVYPLPAVNNKGYILQVDAAGKNIKVVVFSNQKPVSEEHVVYVVVQSRGKAYHAQQGTLKNNSFFSLIPKAKLPDGISQITVFDSQGRPVAERLIHQNHQETVNLVVKTDTTDYKKRNMVTVLADAFYRNGTPATGNFSITVYDETLVKDPDQYPLSITNYLTLTSDLKGTIENPGHYFKDTLTQTRKDLDLLMMVHGWRRFTWKDVLERSTNKPIYKREHGIPLSGKVLKVGGKRPPASSILKVLSMDGNAVQLKPDSLGRFYTDNLLYYDSMTLVFQTENSKGKKQPYKFMLDAPAGPAPFDYTPPSFIKFDATPYLKQQAQQNMILKFPDGIMLKEVDIVEKKIRDPRLVGTADDRLIDMKKAVGYSNMAELVQVRVPFAVTRGNPPELRFQLRDGSTAAPAYLLNGTLVGEGVVSSIPMEWIEYIEVLGPSSAWRYGALRAVSIVLKPDYDSEVIGINKLEYAGFHQAREFYSPNYQLKDPLHSNEDKRTTLFWEPMLITDAEGRAAIAFYTADVASRYRVVIEGITYDGYPGTATTVFEVK